MNHAKKWQCAAALAAAVAIAACGGDSFKAGETVVTGNIILPPGSNCIDMGGGTCTTSNVPVATFQPSENPSFAPTSSTSASGVYSTGDITGFVSGLPGGGDQTVIAVAVVGNADGPPEEQTIIGGLVPLLTPGSVTSKDFNATTHIACQAGVFLTGGDFAPNPPPCADDVVRITGPGFFPANVIDVQRTNILEDASEEIADVVVFPTEVPCSSCAVIICTNGGGNLPTDPNCVAREFAACQTAQR